MSSHLLLLDYMSINFYLRDNKGYKILILFDCKSLPTINLLSL